MSSINIDLKTVEQLRSKHSRLTSSLSSAADQLSSAASGMDPAIKMRRQLQDRLTYETQRMRALEERMYRMSDFMRGAIEQYNSAEGEIKGRLSEITGRHRRSWLENLFDGVGDAYNALTEWLASEDGKRFTEQAKANAAAQANDTRIPIDPLERRMVGIKDIPFEGNWYLDYGMTLRVLESMKADIETNGNLELYYTDQIPVEYYIAIQQSSSVRITGEWDNNALMGIENTQAKHNVERTDNGVVDLATVDALIRNVQKKIEYYDNHPTMKNVDKVMGDFFSNGVGEMVESFGLSFVGSKIIDEFKPSSNTKNPGLKYDEGTIKGVVPPKTVISPEMEAKILEGQRKAHKNELIGGHSPSINNANDNFAVEVLSTNADGTKNVVFTKQFPDGNISKLKKSTLFPDSWSDDQILRSITDVGNTPAVSTRLRDGATWHRATINGVEIDVIKIGDDVTSGYPTGTINALRPSGF